MKSLLELFGVIYLRFRPVPRVWCVWLVAVNAACLIYITHIEAQVVLAVTGIAVLLQTLMYQHCGFIRLLGIVHVMWIPMFAWMATRLDVIEQNPEMLAWLALLFATNAVSFVVDAIDSYLYFNGECEPHYYWAKV